MDNYFEGIDFTKIEIILLVGVFLVFLPIIFVPFEEPPVPRNLIAGVSDYDETQKEIAVILEDKTDEGLALKTSIEKRSNEHQIRIFIVFGVAMFLLILTAYLSRKGYTSYTPWLEKLANDKLAFDMKLFQLVDDDKLVNFYRSTFKSRPEEEIKKSDVIGWKPINDDEKWYSVFTEKIDYRFCEIFFTEVYSPWNSRHYKPDTNDQGEYVRVDKPPERDLYNNPELVPDLSNSELKKKLEKNDGALIKKIIQQIPIFNVENNEKKELEKVKKLMIRKIQIDLLYYAVMTNFRVGLLNATERWLNADDLLKKAEKETDAAARASDVGAGDLNDAVQDILGQLETEMGRNPSKHKKLEGEDEDNDSKKKLAKIKEKMGNRNNWESDEWRAMGSVYYKWKEAGKNEPTRIRRFASKLHITNIDTQITTDDYGIRSDVADKTISERFSTWWNKKMHGISKEVKSDPTEEKWKNHRTVRAVNSLSNSFGFVIDQKPGGAVLFFGVVFGLIIAVALTNSLDIVIEAMQLPDPCDADSCWHTDWAFLYSNIENYSYVIILFLCFFPLGILFYHQGTILLSAKAAEQMTMGSKGLVFVNFLFILLQAIVVYFLASSIGDATSFLYLLIVLVFIDAFWVAIFTAKDMTDDVRDAPVFIEWIILDIIIGMFALVILMNYESVPVVLSEGGWEQNSTIFLMILAVLTTRAAVDYSYGWKNFWSKFADAE